MNNKESLSIGFIGGGNMARAILSGLANHHPKDQIYVADHHEENRRYFSESLGIQSAEHYTSFIEKLDIVVLAIKPQGFPALIKELKPNLPKEIVVLSIAAGVPVESIERAFNIPSLPIIRAMPNTPATVGLGATALYPNADANEKDQSMADLIFTSCGETVWLDDEAQISAVIAVSGSSPAYFYYIMEIMTNVGIELGLSAENSEKLTKQAMLGSARFSQLSDQSLEQLKQNVMSPQGTTEKAIISLEKDHLDAILKRAMDAAYQRDQELSREITDAIS